MSVAEKLNKLNNIKEDIKAALEYKGLTVTDQFDTYAEQIRGLGDEIYDNPFRNIGYMRGEEVPFINRELDKAKAVIEAWNPESTTLKGTNIMFYPVVDTSKVTSMANAFLNMSNIYSVGLLDTRKVTTMKNMFSGCTNLITIPAFDVKEVTDMSYMFQKCTSLESIPALNSIRATTMSYMFDGATLINSIPTLTTDTVQDMSYMFQGCTGLVNADLKGYNFGYATNLSYMFQNCTNLETLDFTGSDFTNVTNWTSIVNGCTSLAKVDLTNCRIRNGFQFVSFSSADEIIYDGVDTSAMTDTSYLFSSSDYGNVDISNFNLSNVTDMSYTFNNNTSDSIILGNVDTSNVTDMSYMFQKCAYITDLDLSGLNVNKVANTAYMFNGCTKLTNIDFSGWNTDSLVNMSYMFQDCTSLDVLDLSMFDTSKVTDMQKLFYNCKTNSLILDGWDFSSNPNKTNWLSGQTSKNVSLRNAKIKGGFSCPYASESIDLTGIDTTACTSFSLASCDAPVIDVSYVNTSNFTSMDSMFSGCSAVSSLNISHFDYSNVTNMNYMFYGCSKLSGTLTMGGNNKVTDMSEMFQGCSKLTKIDLTYLQLDSVTNMDNMFYGCTSLTEIRMGGNPAKITGASNVDYMFNNITTEGILYYNSEYDYSKIIAKLPSTWKAIPLVNATECTSLTIEADNVTSDKTSTTIRYTAIVNGTNPISGATMTGIELTGKVQSSEFGLNTTTSDKTVTISYTYLGVTATTTITQYQKPTYTVTLNSPWQESDINPDAALYNAYKASATKDATLTINLSKGHTEFNLKGLMKSGGQTYLRFRTIDSTSSSLQNVAYLANSTDASDITKYTDIVYTNIDPSVEHTITILADYTSYSYTAYVLLPK